ncbi:MAG TPA: class I SAM-dependent methyltransferase [Thermoanaerobaculia bacterium]|nr:class I SAM-dependent methyltransferase [Thermoanaerobaculia bacterium]
MGALKPHPTLTEYYADETQRQQFLRKSFDETAPWYDWTDRVLSFGSGDWYRREAVKRLGLKPGMKLLDLASGTGVVARAATQVTGDPGSIIGMDPSFGMLRSGVTQSAKVQAPAEALPFASESFDRITIGFAMRHFSDLSVVFRECQRVLRPDGKLMILEITAPESRIGRAMLGTYMGVITPALVRLRTGNARATQLFHYYWETTRDCVRPQVILDALKDAGFAETNRNVEMGIFSEYLATK